MVEKELSWENFENAMRQLVLSWDEPEKEFYTFNTGLALETEEDIDKAISFYATEEMFEHLNETLFLQPIAELLVQGESALNSVHDLARSTSWLERYIDPISNEPMAFVGKSLLESHTKPTKRFCIYQEQYLTAEGKWISVLLKQTDFFSEEVDWNQADFDEIVPDYSLCTRSISDNSITCYDWMDYAFDNLIAGFSVEVFND